MLDCSKNYFELFGLPERFEVDMEQLTERYLTLQRVVHPDRHTTDSDRGRRLALQEAGLVNEAFRTLKDPQARATYILARRGFTSDTSATIDPVFLTEHLELRESLAEAQRQQDPQHTLSSIMDKILQQRETLLMTIAHTLNTNNLVLTQEALHKLQFLERLRRNAEDVAATINERL